MLRARIKRLCKSVGIGLSLVVVTGGVTGGLSPAPAAASCPQSCFTESGTAYSYCYYHPGTTYNGCNFSLECGDNTSSATQIYRAYCL